MISFIKKNHFVVPGVLVALAVLLAVARTSSGQTAAQSPNAGAAPVRIVDPVPLPVTGELTLSGINIGDALTVKSGDKTTLLTRQSVTVSNVTTIGPFDVSSFKSVRLIANASATCGPCSNVRVVVFSGDDIIEDVIVAEPVGTFTRVYDVPGTQVKLQLFNTSTANNGFNVALYGRSN